MSFDVTNLNIPPIYILHTLTIWTTINPTGSVLGANIQNQTTTEDTELTKIKTKQH